MPLSLLSSRDARWNAAGSKWAKHYPALTMVDEHYDFEPGILAEMPDIASTNQRLKWAQPLLAVRIGFGLGRRYPSSSAGVGLGLNK